VVLSAAFRLVSRFIDFHLVTTFYRSLTQTVCVCACVRARRLPTCEVNVGGLINIRTNKKRWESRFCVPTCLSAMNCNPPQRNCVFHDWIKYPGRADLENTLEYAFTRLQTVDFGRHVWISRLKNSLNHCSKNCYFYCVVYSLQHSKPWSPGNWNTVYIGQICGLCYFADN
jgi:hypothetical protein